MSQAPLLHEPETPWVAGWTGPPNAVGEDCGFVSSKNARMGAEHFQAKWIPVRVKKMRQN
jgi:hypothetical protein